MSTRKIYHCIVDDTALITNISEIENWISHNAITLVVPLYTLERLHLMKKDNSQIGSNARKAVKFLDRITSGKVDTLVEPVIIQGPDEQYPTWAEVEEFYTRQIGNETQKEGITKRLKENEDKKEDEFEPVPKSPTTGSGPLSQMLLDKLNFATTQRVASPSSSPPMSPESSAPQSSKTSPEVKAATMVKQDITPVPASLKPLLNPVVWYMHERKSKAQTNMIFLTNSADTQHLARDFGITTKNIHQLRNLIGTENEELKNQHRYENKRMSNTPSLPGDMETKTLFKYEEDDSDEEEVVFKPRAKGAPKATNTYRGNQHMTLRGRGGHARSPRLSFSAPSVTTPTKPQIPIEEIDPDSFDRGSFARGSMPLVNTGNNNQTPFNNHSRGSSSRANYNAGPTRGGSHYHRGTGRGFERGSGRGRGRLFVP